MPSASFCLTQAEHRGIEEAMVASIPTRVANEKGFTLIDMLFVVGMMGVLSTLAIPGLMRAKGAAQSSSAVGTLRVVNSAQLSYAITCGFGFYAPDFPTLGKKPVGAIEAFLPPELATGATFVKAGYNFSLAGTAVPGSPAPVHGQGARCLARPRRAIGWSQASRRPVTRLSPISSTLPHRWDVSSARMLKASS